MGFVLADIKEWRQGMSCVPTALTAITGKTPGEIGEMLRHAAELHGRQISEELRGDYDINDWLKCIRLLGGDWVEGDSYCDKPFAERPTIDEWMRAHMGVELELVFCDDGDGIGHVFATIDGHVVDTYTEGKRVIFEPVPDSYRKLRVKRAFLVFPDENVVELPRQDQAPTLSALGRSPLWLLSMSPPTRPKLWPRLVPSVMINLVRTFRSWLISS